MPKQRYLGILIALVHRRIKQAVSARVSDLRLSPGQFWMLFRIFDCEGGSLGELAQQAGMDEPTVSRVVFALARRGLVHSGVDPVDRRRARLTLTPEGHSLTERLLPVAAEIRDAVEGALTPAERGVVAASLERAVARLESMEQADGIRPAVRTSPRPALEGRVGS